MIEVGALIAKDGSVIHWHCPEGSTAGSLPDSHDLWEVIWKNRDNVLGFAHVHPWNGPTWASSIDLTTFAAIDEALGRRLYWWVISFDHVHVFERLYAPDGKPSYVETLEITYQEAPAVLDLCVRRYDWMDELRRYASVSSCALPILKGNK